MKTIIKSVNLTTTDDKYEVKDHNDHVIARTEAIDIIKTKVKVYDSTSKYLLGEMKKSKFNRHGDKWTVDLDVPMDRRLFVFIPAFISSMQGDDKKKHDKSSGSSVSSKSDGEL